MSNSLDPRHHANGVPEPAKVDTRFVEVQKAVHLAAGFVEGAANEFHTPKPTPADWQPKPVKIVFTDGRVLEVNYQVALQRILAGIAELVTE
jgi:hypothetical protein